MSGERRRAVLVERVRDKGRMRAGDAQDGGVDEKPRSVYEVVTRQMLLELKEDLAEVKGRVNTLLWLVLGAAVVEFIMRLVR
ncbi:MAG TPA: hypothetical protein VJ183_07850 [Chloroflexia bacterium]|nr:hypothetical protein [Chloroflexia bacterium]